MSSSLCVLLLFRNPPNSADVDEFGDLLALEKEWLINNSEAEDEEPDEAQNISMLSQNDLLKIKEEVLEMLDKDKEQCMTVWETVAERVCAFAGQVCLAFGNFLFNMLQKPVLSILARLSTSPMR